MKKIDINKKLKIYKTIVKSLTKSQEEEFNRAHRKQLRQVWNDKDKKNTALYEESGEMPMDKVMKKPRWRSFGHMLRMHKETPCQKAMEYYFDVSVNAKKYSGKQRITLPTKIDDDIKQCAKINNINISNFETIYDLHRLQEKALDRKEWRKFSDLICNVAEGNRRL